MRPLYAAALMPLLAACAPQEADMTRIVNTIPPTSTAACVAATAAEAGITPALVTMTGARPEATGPALIMNANGREATCKLNAAGEVTSVTF